MKLEFDSISELNQFLNFAQSLGGALAATCEPIGGARVMTYATGAPVTPTSLSSMVVGAAGTGASGSAGVAFDTPPGAAKTYTDGTTATGPGPLPDQSPAQQDTELATTKRKRRTKAEIEATAAAEAKPEEAAALAAAVVSGEAQPAGTNPFDQPSTLQDVGAEGTAATGEGDEKSAEPEVVTPFQHLTRAREFIAKHGMPKYNESFTKAGLDANVMGYSAYQRGLHMDALDALEKA